MLASAQRYVYTEQNSGIVLLVATALALLCANSALRDTYHSALETSLAIELGPFRLAKDLQHWINDGLMAIFFFVVGLEIKRELTHGELSKLAVAALPIAAAAGGMVAPALIYVSLNAGGPGASGWGIPMATDIAFAVGVMALVGPRIPPALRMLLLTLAVVDDIGAILVIAIFYSGNLSLPAFAAAAALLAVIVLLRQLGLRSVTAYVALGALFWLAVYLSGVHATIAGVVLGLLAPARPLLSAASFRADATAIVRGYGAALDASDSERAEALLGQLEELTVATEAPVDRLERSFHPWASYFVLPLFALANAGVTISIDTLDAAFASPITWGAGLGLLVGKPLGICAAVFAAVQLRVARLPREITWKSLLGVGALAGIGFTMSIFITELAFGGGANVEQAKIGVFAASFLSAVIGFVVLTLGSRAPTARRAD